MFVQHVLLANTRGRTKSCSLPGRVQESCKSRLPCSEAGSWKEQPSQQAFRLHAAERTPRPLPPHLCSWLANNGPSRLLLWRVVPGRPQGLRHATLKRRCGLVALQRMAAYPLASNLG